MTKYRVALYYLAVEGASPADALVEARKTQPDSWWTSPQPTNRPRMVDDPLIDQARWLLQEWATRAAGYESRLADESRLVATQLQQRGSL